MVAPSRILRGVRARMLAVPGHVAQQLPTLTRAASAAAEATVAAAAAASAEMCATLGGVSVIALAHLGSNGQG